MPPAPPTLTLPPAPPQTVPAPPATGLTVPPGVTIGTGDVQVTLLWQDPADLDLHVFDPSNFELCFSSAKAPLKSPSGGTLDVDQNAGCTGGTGQSTSHVENVFWPSGAAPSGTYRAVVVDYNPCEATNFSYELRVRAHGRIVYDQRGTVGSGRGASSAAVSFVG